MKVSLFACLLGVGWGTWPSSSAAQLLNYELRTNGATVLAAFEGLEEVVAGSTIEIHQGRRDLQTLATVIRPDLALCKASELPPPSERELHARTSARDRGQVEVLAEDEQTDLALLRINLPEVVPVRWAESAQDLGQGTWVISSMSKAGKIRAGILSAKTRPIEREGGVLGVTLSAAEEGEVGLVVKEMTEGGPAAQAGLKIEDLILELNGEAVGDLEAFVEAIKAANPGSEVDLLVQSGQEEKRFSVTLAYRGQLFDRFDRNQQMSGFSSLRRAGFEMVLQHDTTLAPESMGGPLFDLAGRCLGINIARADRVTTFALPVEVVKRALARLQGDESVKKAASQPHGG
ncbi:MAG: PDZ domain-containing protein [Verrucomicrobiota bacterium]